LLTHTKYKARLGYYLVLTIITLSISITMTLLAISNQHTNQTPPPLVVSQQLLIPSKTWDWTEAQTGFLPKTMINFVDTLPASCAQTANFNFSSNRLFENYSILLDLVDDSFQPRAALVAAKKSIQRPSFSPVSDNDAPLGWAKTLDGGGIIRWTPSYNISIWPEKWLTEVKSQGGNPQTIRIPIVSNTQKSLQLTTENSVSKKVSLINKNNYLEIKALAWNRVKVTPGNWFNSGLVQLLKNHQGGFSGGYNRDSLFGTKGLLNCRITEILVAYKPQMTLLGDSEFVQQHEADLMSAQKISLGSINFSNVKKKQLNGKKSLYTLSSPSENAIIIAVNVLPI
jgi:hypothetical protein